MDLVKQITELYERDQKSDAKAVAASDIPIRYESITPDWMTHILCKGYPDAKVVEVNLDNPDDGSANRRRVFVKYNEAGINANLPTSVFCKASQGLNNRINLALSGGTHSEVTFFNKIRPYINDADIPRAYFAAYDESSFNSIIVLEDIESDVEFCRHWTPINFDQALSQLELLAKFHTRFENNPGLNAQAFGMVSWQDYWAACVVSDLETFSNKGFRAAEEVIPPRLFKRYEEIWPATEKSVAIHDYLPATLLHGDCHLKQWFIRNSTGKMGLTDWQGCSFGHWSRDLAYCVSTSLAIADRRKWERELLQRYLEFLKEGGAEVPSFDKAWLLYRQNLMSSLAYWTVTLTPAPTQPDMQPQDTCMEFIKRMTHAIDDLDVLDTF
jgi:Phosphotransferase enzyme family